MVYLKRVSGLEEKNHAQNLKLSIRGSARRCRNTVITPLNTYGLYLIIIKFHIDIHQDYCETENPSIFRKGSMVLISKAIDLLCLDLVVYAFYTVMDSNLISI